LPCEIYCREILRESPTNAAAIAWALARAFLAEGKHRALDPVAASRALEDLLASGRGDILHLSVLASLLSWRGKASKVVATLRRYQHLFADGTPAEGFAALQAEATLRSGGEVADAAGVDQDRAEVLRALRETDPSTARDRLVVVARRLHDVGSTDLVFIDALFRLAALGFVRETAPFAGRLVELAGTLLAAAEPQAAQGSVQRAAREARRGHLRDAGAPGNRGHRARSSRPDRHVRAAGRPCPSGRNHFGSGGRPGVHA